MLSFDMKNELGLKVKEELMNNGLNIEISKCEEYAEEFYEECLNQNIHDSDEMEEQFKLFITSLVDDLQEEGE